MKVIIFLLLYSLWSCKKQDIPEPTPVSQDTVLKIEWIKPIKNGIDVVAMRPTRQYKDWILIGDDIDNPTSLFAFNKTTGVKDWEYHHQGVLQDQFRKGVVLDNIFVGMTLKSLIAINLDTRQPVWEIDFHNKGYLTSKDGVLASNNKFYLKLDSLFHSGRDVHKLLEVDMPTGNYKEIYTWQPDSFGVYSSSPPTIYSDHLTGKSFLIMNEYPGAQLPPQEDYQNIIAIDMETNEVAWRTSHFTEHFYSNSLHPPIVYNDIVITGGDWSIYAFNARTGEQLWRHEFDYPWAVWSKTNHLIHDGRLYVNNSQFDVTCLNPETGALIWNNPQGGPNCTDNMVYYEKEDLLVFTSWGYGAVMVLDALTGKTLHKELPKDNSTYYKDVVYDPETDMFFTSTYKSVVGFKVKRPK